MRAEMETPGITVTGYGEASAPPDVLRAALSVGFDAADVSDALQGAAERSAAVSAAMRELGLADRDLRTTGISVQQRHNGDGALVGYRAVHSLTVSSGDLSLGGRLLSTAVAAAGNYLSIDHVSLDIDAREPLRQQARAAAFADARARAEQYADLAGRALGAIEVVREGAPVGGPAPLGGVMLEAARAEMPIEPGENTLSASVTVTWRWA